MHFLSLPDELFIYGIFPYLHSADLLRAFGTSDNYHLRALVHSYIRHLDLCGAIDLVDELPYCHRNAIQSLRIEERNLRDEILSSFAMLDRLDVQMTLSTSRSISPRRMMHLTQRKKLHLSFTTFGELSTDDRLASLIWDSESRVQDLSVTNCILLDQSDCLASSQLAANVYLTRLSLDVVHLSDTLPLVSLAPALTCLEVRLHHRSFTSSGSMRKTLEGREWPRGVKSLRVLAHNRLVDTHHLCTYIRLLAASLERLSFYVHLRECYLMRGHRSFHRHLLDHLPHLKQLDFCVHSGLASIDPDYRRTFDRWQQQRHVISIFHAAKHTRFTLPFVFDRLERVTNAFVDYHSNECRSDFVLMLPSITLISFYSATPLSLGLFTWIQRVCPRLRRMHFKQYCTFADDLVQDTQLTLPTVKQMHFDLNYFIGADVSFERLFGLTPNLDHLNVDGTNLPTILNLAERRCISFDTIHQLIIVRRRYWDVKNRAVVAEQFPNANVIYEDKCSNYGQTALDRR